MYPARDVVQSVSYNISALISCNFIIKNYVNRKIRSYIYLLSACGSGLSLSTHRPVTTKDSGKYDSIGDKKEKSMCTHKTS